MSFTGNFVSAVAALDMGLVNYVVPHDELLPTARRLAADIAGCDQAMVTALNETYREVAATTLGEGLAIERRRFR
jgi:enoyl-CoA hydratase